MWGVKELLLILSIQMNLKTSKKKKKSLPILISRWGERHSSATVGLQLPCKAAGGRLPVSVWDKVTCSFVCRLHQQEETCLHPANLHRHVRMIPFHAKKGCADNTIQYYDPTPNASWSRGLHLRVRVWMRRISGASGGGENSRWQGCPRHVCFLGENNASLRALIKGGEGDLSPRTAGRQRASHPPLSLRVHTQTHTLQLTGTGHGLNIYQAHANKRPLEENRD